MKPLSFHLKISLIASVISFVVLLVFFIIICASIAGRIRADEKALAELQSRNLAEQLSLSPAEIDQLELQRLTDTVSGSRPNLVTVRIWKLDNQKFSEVVDSNDSLSAEDIGEETRNALLNKSASETVGQQTSGETGSFYRVFSPIINNNQVTGAVEIIEKLDTISTIAVTYLWNLSWIAAATILLMTAALYLILQRLVYQPLDHLLMAMESAKEGNLQIEVAEKVNPDEFGKLSNNFNEMMLQIRQMTAERERQNGILTEKVHEATSELVDKNALLERANLELFQSSRKMTEMERFAAAGQNAAQFAHEVGTPLNIISGHVQLLQTATSENPRLQTIATQVERIENIVRDMLDRTRFGKTEHRELNINQVLRKMLDAVEPILGKSQVNLETNFAKNLPNISGDPERLQQVFLNLFKNSLDAMPTGGRLSISTSTTDGKVVVDFSDNGIGMSEATATKIFQPLFTTKQRGEGTGLGLVIVKQILDEHIAEIRVDSHLKQGTTFSLIFPTSFIGKM